MPMRFGLIRLKKRDDGSPFCASIWSITNMMSGSRLANESTSSAGSMQ